MTITEIRTALHEVHDAVEVPPVDRLDFQRRVRSARRRRTTGRALVATAAAAAAVAGVALVGGVTGPGERSVDVAPSGPSAATGGVSETVYFVLDGRLTALDPTGRVHDLGLDAEAVVGFTSERVYVIDSDSRLVVHATVYDDESRRVPTFIAVGSPVDGPVQTAALSGDGRYLAWTDLADVSHRFDLKADRQDVTVPGDPRTSVIGVGPDGLLLYSRDGLVVRDSDSEVPVPVSGDWWGAGSQTALGHVLVNERDGSANLYDISSGTAELVDTIEGNGVLGPYAERVATVVGDQVEVWDGGTTRSVTGLDAAPDQVRWADEQTLLVAAHDDEGGSLWACDIELACARLPVTGEVSLNR